MVVKQIQFSIVFFRCLNYFFVKFSANLEEKNLVFLLSFLIVKKVLLVSSAQWTGWSEIMTSACSWRLRLWCQAWRGSGAGVCH